jgi:hypothetical protein
MTTQPGLEHTGSARAKGSHPVRPVPSAMDLHRRGEVSSPPEPASALPARIRARREKRQGRSGTNTSRRKNKPPRKVGGQPRLPKLQGREPGDQGREKRAGGPDPYREECATIETATIAGPPG